MMQTCVSWDFRRDNTLLESKFDYLIEEKNIYTNLKTPKAQFFLSISYLIIIRNNEHVSISTNKTFFWYKFGSIISIYLYILPQFNLIINFFRYHHIN